MSLDENKVVAKRIVNDVFNARKYDIADALVASDFRSHNPRVPPGQEGFKAFAHALANGFPDLTGEIQETLAEGDRVMIWIRWRGTHNGAFAGVPATGNKVDFDTIEIFRFVGGKVVEHWDVADRLSLQSALGLVRPAQ